jgi:hypothetical protein
VAELADAPGLGPGGREAVGVRVSPLAPVLTCGSLVRGSRHGRPETGLLLTLAHRRVDAVPLSAARGTLSGLLAWGEVMMSETSKDGARRLELVVETSNVILDRTIEVASPLAGRVEQGLAAKAATGSAAVRWGRDGFVFVPGSRTGSGVRELGDVLLVHGSRGLVVLVKSRFNPGDDATRERNWCRSPWTRLSAASKRSATNASESARGRLDGLRTPWRPRYASPHFEVQRDSPGCRISPVLGSGPMDRVISAGEGVLLLPPCHDGVSPCVAETQLREVRKATYQPVTGRADLLCRARGAKTSFQGGSHT